MERPDFKKEFLTKYLGAQNELRNEHYRAAPLPHFTPMPYGQFLNAIAAGGHSTPSYFGYAVLPGESPNDYHGWTMFWCYLEQGGAYSGTGLLVRYKTSVKDNQMVDEPVAGRWEICQHEKVSTASHHQQMHGWHGGYCKKCGLDMSYDSSD